MTDTIILGLDGATWDVLDGLLEDERLPNLSSLFESGVSGDLESTFPPITAPAWLSMATGQNPGKTGVFYFLNRDDPDSFEFESLGSDEFRGRTFWDVLAARGYDVGIFNYPMLYPPYDPGNDSFVVSGIGSPEDDTITHPVSLQAELDDVTDGYQIKVPYADPKYRDRPGALEADLHEIVEKRERAIEYLLTEKRPDVFFGVVSATDWAQHYFWRHYDDSHPLHDEETSEEYGDTIGRLWERVDETVGRVADIADREDATLLVVSDHGFGPVNRTFHSNTWLTDRGFTTQADQSLLQKLRTDYFPYIQRIAEPVVAAVPQLNDLATSVGRSVRGSPGDVIDWERSIAFAPKQGLSCGMLYLLSDDPSDREAVVSALLDLENPDGELPDVEIHDPEDLYHGPKTELAPDILFTIGGLACAVDPRFTTTKSWFTDGPPSSARSGGHRMQGIYCLRGPGIGAGEGDDASLFDVAPTVLYALDEPIPSVVDGDVLLDAFTDAARESRSERRLPLSELTDYGTENNTRDTNAVQDRLEDLGYI